MTAKVLAAVLLLTYAAEGRAVAQVPPGASTEGFDVNLWHPGAGADEYLGGEGAAVLAPGRFAFGLFVGYVSRPLVAVVSQNGMTTERPVVDSAVRDDLVLAFGIDGRHQLALDVPFDSAQEGTLAGVDMAPPSGTLLGDLRLDYKLRLWRARDGQDGFGVAIGIGASAPTGDAPSFASQGAWGARPRLIVEQRGRGYGVALDLGAFLRSDHARFVDLDIQHELVGTLAVRVALGPLPLHALAQMGARRSVGGEGGPASLELLGGLAWQVLPGFELAGAAGGGFSDGYGTPALRIVFGVRVALPERP